MVIDVHFGSHIGTVRWWDVLQ